MDDLRFAWIVCKHVKSNAIVLAKDRTLLGAGAGQMSRVNSARLAAQLAHQYGGTGSVDLKGCVAGLATPSSPSPTAWMWPPRPAPPPSSSPAAARRTQDVIARADELGLAMILTGTRHFNH